MCVELTLLPDAHVKGGAEKNKICREAYMFKVTYEASCSQTMS